MKSLQTINRNFLAFALALAAMIVSGYNSAFAQASAYVSQMSDAADQMTTDLGAVLPIALGVAVVSVGVFIVWAIFKRLARG